MTSRKNACCRLLIAASVMASGEDAPEAILLRMVVRFARFASRVVLRNLSPAWKWRGFDVSPELCTQRESLYGVVATGWFRREVKKALSRVSTSVSLLHNIRIVPALSKLRLLLRFEAVHK